MIGGLTMQFNFKTGRETERSGKESEDLEFECIDSVY